jgi:hypothetical protein
MAAPITPVNSMSLKTCINLSDRDAKRKRPTNAKYSGDDISGVLSESSIPFHFVGDLKLNWHPELLDIP